MDIHIHIHECMCLWRPEGSVESTGAGGTQADVSCPSWIPF